MCMNIGRSNWWTRVRGGSTWFRGGLTWLQLAIKWADSGPPRYRRGPASDLGGPVADLWRIRRVHFSRGLKWIRPGSARTQPRTQKSTADPPRIRHRYAAEPWTKSPPKKLKKSASPPNESESVRRGLFFGFGGLFWWTRVR